MSYFTLFFCSKQWSNVSRDLIYKFIEFLLIQLEIDRSNVQTIYKKTGHTKDTIEKGYKTIKTVAYDQSVFSYIISAMEKNYNIQFNTFFESERVEMVPEYIKYLSSSRETRLLNDAYKVLSISIEYSIYEKKLKGNFDFLQRIIELYCKMNCQYGYGKKSTKVITSVYSLIDNTNIRIIDFDYNSYIEDIYEINFVSDDVMKKVGNIESIISEFENEKTGPILFGEKVAGYYFQIKNDEDKNEWRTRFSGVINKNSVINIPILLLNYKQYQVLTSLAELKDKYMGYEIGDKQTDFYQIENTNIDWNIILKLIFSKLNIAIDTYSLPYVIHADLFDKSRIYYRYTQAGLEYEKQSKLIIVDRNNLINTDLTMVFNCPLKNERESSAVEYVRSIINYINSNYKCYGKISIKNMTTQVINNKTLLCYKVDISQINQNGINLLMLIIDELYSDEVFVPWVIIGDLKKELHGFI